MSMRSNFSSLQYSENLSAYGTYTPRSNLTVYCIFESKSGRKSVGFSWQNQLLEAVLEVELSDANSSCSLTGKKNVVSSDQPTASTADHSASDFPMDRWVGKVAVVTGASAGIGEAIAKDLVRSGLQVVGLARRRSKLESIGQSLANEKGKFYAYECDVGSEESVEKAFSWIKETLGGVHVLINNAGIGVNGSIIDLDAENFRKVFNINVLGLLYCTQQALRIMRDEKIEGTIININSIQGHRVHPFPGVTLNVYPGSKHAVTGIIDELQHELRDENLRIRMTSISPGYVNTDLATAGNFETEELKNLVQLESEDIADAVSYILSTPQRVQISELTIRPLGEKY